MPPRETKEDLAVITVHLRYEINSNKLADFEEYGRRWIRLVNRLGGEHHGYFLPSEGDSDEAFALFTFPSFSDYEKYRSAAAADPECIEGGSIRNGNRLHPTLRATIPLTHVRIASRWS